MRVNQAISTAFPWLKPVECEAMTMSLFFLLSLTLTLSLSDGASVPVVLQQQHNAELSLDLESLASSKILMDHTSSPSSTTPLDPRASTAMENLLRLRMSSSRRQTPLSTPSLGLTQNKILSGGGEPGSENFRNDARFNLNNGKSSPERTTTSTISTIHVAQCRATCLQEFAAAPSPSSGAASPSDSDYYSKADEILTPSPALESRREEVGDFDETQMIYPKMLRSKRRKRSTGKGFRGSVKLNKKILWNCEHDSLECRSCWKSCQLFESLSTSNPEISLLPIEMNHENKANEVGGSNAKNNNNSPRKKFIGQSLNVIQEEKRKQSREESGNKQFPFAKCSSTDCGEGCQLACSFYKLLFAKNVKNLGKQGSTPDPVVETRQEIGVVKILPGKISWSLNSGKRKGFDGKSGFGVPVVYILIQEYPDRGWRQIAQTTSEEIEIPEELTRTMEAKLRSVRVLVVGPQGLVSVYSGNALPSRPSGSKPERSRDENTKFSYKRSNSGDGGVVMVESSVMLPEMKSKTGRGGKHSDDDGAEANTVKVNGGSDSQSDYSTPNIYDLVSGREQGKSDEVLLDNEKKVITPSENDASLEQRGDPFRLKVVSLIHQKSLVIAELKWDEIEGRPSQDYLITWELSGGGLKGHLVTDSTSVTLSLWPDTFYRIQVEQLQLNLDSDGEQPGESSPSTLKSQLLLVNTSDASFPTGESAALSGNNEGSGEGDYVNRNEDEYPMDVNETGKGKEEALPHKSFMGLQNNTLLLLVTGSATILVILILLAAAFFWTRSQTLKKLACCQNCFAREREPHLLSSQEGLNENEEVDSVNSYDSPMAFILDLKRNAKSGKKQKPNWKIFKSKETKGLESEAPVAVISSSSSSATPNLHSFFHCFLDNVGSNKSPCLSQPTFFSGLDSEKVDSSKPLSLSSSSSAAAAQGETTTASAVAGWVIKGSEQHCSSSSAPYELPNNSDYYISGESEFTSPTPTDAPVTTSNSEMERGKVLFAERRSSSASRHK